MTEDLLFEANAKLVGYEDGYQPGWMQRVVAFQCTIN